MAGPDIGPHPSAKVRVVGKIRGFTKSESLGQDARPWITVSKPQEDSSPSVNKVTVSFSDQSTGVCKKDISYELNYCYHQDEDMEALFSREIRPLISDVFEGGDASIITYGARGSGKTALIQGMENKPGLSMMAMAEFLSKARDLGKSVSLSVYEVFQEHAYDLLDPDHVEIQVLEDARGRIKLKGLSQVSVGSLSQFNEYLCRSFPSKIGKKILFELPKRSHKVVVIYLTSMDGTSTINCGGKMNFVDLAGYEDTRRKSSDGNILSESVRINKSLHATLNVIYALSTNENHVPFRESKLTRTLQDSLGGENPMLLLACMNPLFCPDTIHTVSLASRSCQSVNHVLTNSTKKGESLTRFQALSSQKTVRSSATPKVVKKQRDLSVQLPTKEATSMSNGSKLEEAKNMICNQVMSPQRDGPVKKFDNPPETMTAIAPLLVKEAFGDRSLTNRPLPLVADEVVCKRNLNVDYPLVSWLEVDGTHTENGSNNLEVTPVVTYDTSVQEHGKENKDLIICESGSPPLSERLREISANLKSFCSSTPSRLKLLEESIPTGATEVTEPKTPNNENYDMNLKFSSPWDAFNRGSSRMKDSLVQESLKFLNTASKDEMKRLKGIGEKRATWILELREESPEPFKNLEDLTQIGLSAKQIKGMMKKVAGELFG